MFFFSTTALLDEFDAPPDRPYPPNDEDGSHHLQATDKDLSLAPSSIVRAAGRGQGAEAWNHEVHEEEYVGEDTRCIRHIADNFPQSGVLLSMIPDAFVDELFRLILAQVQLIAQFIHLNCKYYYLNKQRILNRA